MLKKTQKQLEKARISLLLNEPFFASAALKMEYEENEAIETGSTNGLRIQYNPNFFLNLRAEERCGFIAHEILHVISMHPLRIGSRKLKVWNEACDYVINPLLKDAGITIPSGGLFNSYFNGMSAEEIYEILIKQQQDQKEDQQEDGNNSGAGFGDVEAPPEEADVQQMEQEAKQMGIEAYNAAKQAGSVTNGMKDFIDDLVEPKQNWRDILNRFVCEVVKNDYTWKKPNPRYIPVGMYLPSLESLEIGKIVFAIDTSGSVDRELLTEFVSEIKDAMSIFSIPVTVIHCDTKVQAVEQLTEDDKITPKGRGGTAFQPVFDYVNKEMEDVKAIVYFTDGDCYEKFYEPEYPVLWAIYNNKHFKCDFGEIINVD